MNDVKLVTAVDNVAIADWLEQRLRVALDREPGQIAVAVPGGSTPFPILELLVERNLEFARLAVWPTDDRIVAEDHPASNTGRIRRLFEPAGATVVALAQGLAPPQFALVWLGMGADGHIASLFPNIDPQGDDVLAFRCITPDPLPPEAPFDRITLTLPALLRCDELLFVIRGEEKCALFEAALRGENDLPIARLLAARNQGHHRPVTCFA